MKKIPKTHFKLFAAFLTVIGYKAKMNGDGSMCCINPRMKKERRQIVLWASGKMNKACQILWQDYLNHWLAIGKEFISELRKVA